MPREPAASRSFSRSATAAAAAVAAAAFFAAANSGCTPGPGHGTSAAPTPRDTTAVRDTLLVVAAAGEPGIASLIQLVPPGDTARYLKLALLQPGVDPRDLLDSGTAGAGGPADILVSRDPIVLSYARARPDLTVLPLAWDRVHAAVITDPTRSRINASPALRESLARDAVRADARAADRWYPWSGLACGADHAPPSVVRPRVAYVRGDATGREIAERLVALDRSVSAAELDSAVMAEALANGRDAVYVIELPAQAAEHDACALLPARAAQSAIVPLVETRAHAIVREGVPSLDPSIP